MRVWTRSEDGRLRSSFGEERSFEEFLGRLKKLSMETPYLVQPKFVNHPEFRDFSKAGFISLRIITAVDESGDIVVLFADAKLPRGDAINDNIATGTYCVSVDRHPDTGAAITGRKIPFFREATKLARDGHRTLNDWQRNAGESLNFFFGWDIGLSPDGPVIIEANMHFADTFQVSGRGPDGESRFAELLCHHLDRLEPEYGPV